MSKKYRTDAMASIHETMGVLGKVGAIDKQAMRRFDAACLTPRQGRTIREDTATDWRYSGIAIPKTRFSFGNPIQNGITARRDSA